DRFLKHVERCAAFLHLIDATAEDVVTPYVTIRRELELYKADLIQKPEIVALNKCDSLTEDEIKQKIKAIENVCNHKVYAISAIAKQGVTDCLRDISQFVTRNMRKNDEQEPQDNVKKTWSPLD
ncbi:MAG: GTPase ObgE, partial [Alphaproteobacteria bacterium]|nr:GTPase ObgE [Alphaproteobacteria bacterium]